VALCFPGLLVCDPASEILRVRVLNTEIFDPLALVTATNLVDPNLLFTSRYAVRFGEDTYATHISRLKLHPCNIKIPKVRVPFGSNSAARRWAIWFSKSAVNVNLSEITQGNY
jgi:hypothetical protein